ncbi:MAG: hypothetical protein KAT68_01725 [Bacteroidales bacterium]|nr:hypothetical protein [Bacteroidales bacterium]
MKFFCLEDFKVEVEKLISKKAYSTLEKDIINYFFGKSLKELCSGTRLNNNDKTPYIKKRIKGSSGFRIYFLLIIKDESFYFMFVHPKTGSMGAINITDESKAHLYKKILECIKANNLYSLELDKLNEKIIFEKVKKIKP